MRYITKRSGQEEDFKTEKIILSMRAAGVSQDTAEQVAAEITYHEGISTREVRNRVVGGIKNREPQAAMRYESHPKKAH